MKISAKLSNRLTSISLRSLSSGRSFQLASENQHKTGTIVKKGGLRAAFFYVTC
jgi:hypothetical protein